MKLIRFIFSTSYEYKGLLIGMVFAMFFVALDSNLRPYIIKLLIDNANHFELNKFIYLVAMYLTSQMVCVVSLAVFDWLGTLYHTNYRSKITHTYLEKLSKYPYSFFQNTQSGTITARVTDAFNSIPVVVFISMNMFLQLIFLILIAVGIIMQVSYLFGITILVWIGIFIIISRKHLSRAAEHNKEYAKCRPKIFGFVTDYFTNIMNVWFFSRVKNEQQKLKILTSEFIDKSIGFGNFLRNYYISYGCLVTLYIFLTFIILGYLSMHKIIKPGDFALIFMISYKIAEKLSEISNKLIEFTQQIAIANNAIALLENQTQKNEITELRKDKLPQIIFKEVNFKYAGADRNIFNNLSITINPGQKIGLVGFSGSGKSTLINLITRLQEVSSGSILINDQNISTYSLESLRELIGIVPQDPSLFHRSLFDNIACSKPEATIEEVLLAAKKAQVDQFVSDLPEKYDTIVGERGLKLSGGQRQRIAIARAILKNAPIFIMDEATSQLDSITEEVIKSILQDFMLDKTSIIVAHRLSTVVNMDRILVFDQGKIVQDGKHDELLNKGDLYYKFWEAGKNKN